MFWTAVNHQLRMRPSAAFACSRVEPRRIPKRPSNDLRETGRMPPWPPLQQSPRVPSARSFGALGVAATGPITRLMSPSDFGQLLKPFVFLDLFDNHGSPSEELGLHPHSGIATLTYLAEGSVRYEDTNGATGILPAGGVEWMQAGGGVWHGGGVGDTGRTRGFQLWIALPPQLELGPSVSRYEGPGDIPHDGPASVLLGSYGSAMSAIDAPSPINYLAVRLKKGERWRYQPPAGHTVLWAAVGRGVGGGSRRACRGRPRGFRALERRRRVRGAVRRGVCRRLSRAARSRPRPWLLLRTHEPRSAARRARLASRRSNRAWLKRADCSLRQIQRLCSAPS